MAEQTEREQAERRIMRFVSGGRTEVRDAACAGKLLLDGEDRGTISVSAEVFRQLVERGSIVRHGDEVTRRNDARPAKTVSQERASQSVQRDLDVVTVERDGAAIRAIVNLSESPLGQLMRRKTRDGAPFLTEAEFRAGERLRADYTRGQIMPRLGANWEASVASGRRASGNGIAELTDAALAARLRVERAIAAVGPELSGVLIDICCFLKGLELVEAERGWPVRSAKIVLKTALGALSRHYEPARSANVRRPARMLHWGSEDYRPRMV
ncbi:hypothetical protein M2281_000656 [Mesorhizobium soli]|uniref:DUF6456 domain-containing protein n=1 Tax=Pseudaminobacter soli (ex Li et al. 2025) TaxID=1295366 RepID=UPI0024767D6E|nr:DUF6456 domain-containing protein [Mesorhizobium soli]MDH6230084.1 hypothetical protein [Mesorhizobium soli]